MVFHVQHRKRPKLGTLFFVVYDLLWGFFVGINGLINAGFTILGLVIILFLFQKPSSDWFREMKSRSKTPPIFKDTRKYDEKGDKL